MNKFKQLFAPKVDKEYLEFHENIQEFSRVVKRFMSESGVSNE